MTARRLELAAVNVRVHIGALVLDRPVADDAPAVARAVKSELARLLAEQIPGRLTTAGHSVELAAPLPRGATTATALGSRVAEAVHVALGARSDQ